MPAIAQLVEPEAPAAPGGAAPTPGPAGGLQQPLVPGGAGDILPLPPQGGFAFPNPLNPPGTVGNVAPPAATAVPTTPLGLPAPGFGVSTLQALDPTAPAYVIRPRITASETLTDNVNYQHSPRTADAYTILSPGVSFSADTPRFQGVATGGMNAYIYARESSNDQVVGSFYGNGLATVWPDKLFVDLQSAITQSTASPTFGFQNLSQLPTNQQTQVYTNNISPYLRQSFDGLIDSEVRYRFNSTQYGGNTTVVAAPASTAAASNLTFGILNEGTLTVATGRDFERTLSRVTVDALNFNGPFTSRNTQVSGFDDLEYRITPQIAALARVGYQNIRYPASPEATFAGATWLAGGRIGSYGPEPAYLALEYGRQQGVYGFTGSAQYSITPTMVFTANLAQGLTTSSQNIQSSLSTSTLDPFGSIVDEYSGLPTAFYSPGVGLTNNVYRQHIFSGSLSETIGLNRLSLYVLYSNQQSLTPPVTAPTKSYGINFSWYRDVRPDLTGYFSVGYFNSSNVVVSMLSSPLSSAKSVIANLGINYSFTPSLTGSILYGLSYQNNGAANAGRTSGDVVVNQLTFQVSKSF